MKPVFKSALLAGFLATVGTVAFAQAPGPADGHEMMACDHPMHAGMEQGHMGRMSPEKMQARHDKRNAALKAKLKLTPEQEGAWSTYTAALRPPADMRKMRPDFAELAKLPTPERIDKMKALRTQHMTERSAAMDQRGEATKAFYATLTPEQQKVFDSFAMQRPGSRQHHRGDGKPAQ